MIYYFYHHDYRNELSYDFVGVTDGEKFSRGPLAQHARMYAMGEKYGVSGLKALALRKFLRKPVMIPSGLCTAMVITYASTPNTDLDMRNKLIEYLHRFPKVVKIDTVEKTLQELPDLVFALYRNLLDEKIKT